MCQTGCTYEDFDGDCRLKGSCAWEIKEEDDCREPDEYDSTEQETSDAEDRYFR